MSTASRRAGRGVDQTFDRIRPFPLMVVHSVDQRGARHERYGVAISTSVYARTGKEEEKLNAVQQERKANRNAPKEKTDSSASSTK